MRLLLNSEVPSPALGASLKNLDVQQILPLVISTVEQAGRFLAQEYVRPAGRRGYGDKADIDLEIEEVLRAKLLKLLPCDWWGEGSSMSSRTSRIAAAFGSPGIRCDSVQSALRLTDSRVRRSSAMFSASI